MAEPTAALARQTLTHPFVLSAAACFVFVASIEPFSSPPRGRYIPDG